MSVPRQKPISNRSHVPYFYVPLETCEDCAVLCYPPPFSFFALPDKYQVGHCI